LGTFLLFFLSADVSVVDDDLVNLIPVVLLLEIDLFVESVQLLLQFLDRDLLELNLAFQFLVSGQKLFVSCCKLVLFQLQLADLLLQA
jgi:hypothetical protein